MERSPNLKVMAVLAIVQGVFGLRIQLGANRHKPLRPRAPAGSLSWRDGSSAGRVYLDRGSTLCIVRHWSVSREELGMVALYHGSHHQFISCCGRLGPRRAPHRGNRLVGNSSGVACLLLLTKKRRCGRRLT